MTNEPLNGDIDSGAPPFDCPCEEVCNIERISGVAAIHINALLDERPTSTSTSALM